MFCFRQQRKSSKRRRPINWHCNKEGPALEGGREPALFVSVSDRLQPELHGNGMVIIEELGCPIGIVHDDTHG